MAVLIPAYNEERNISQLVEFLRVHARHSTAPTELAVWIDVSGSTDRTRATVEELAERWGFVHIVDEGSRDGLLNALNRLLARAEGDLTLRLDADVLLEPGTIPCLLDQLESSQAGIISPRIRAAVSPSGWANALVQGEYEIHHRVCLQEPKTTLVQLFRSVPVQLRPDAGIEDGELQEQVTRSEGPAAYAPMTTLTVVPPASVRQYLQQRLRTIQHTRHHQARGYARPSTASPRVVTGAILDALRAGEVPRRSTMLFLGVEIFARVAAPVVARVRPSSLFQWDPLSDTKQPDWGATEAPRPEAPSQTPLLP
ncbi:MAG: glycosyltransferase family 2 protein [Thermoplasmata archaeon]|nr:glycosyltransferase family 2 protein [Thermoplasmata archaeon]